jgi:hypothetical protein
VCFACAWIADEDKNLPLSLGESLEEVLNLLDELLSFDFPVVVQVVLFSCLDWELHSLDRREALVSFSTRAETSGSSVHFVWIGDHEVKAILGAYALTLTVREKVDRGDVFALDDLLD